MKELVGRDGGVGYFVAAVFGALPTLLFLAAIDPHGWDRLRLDTVVITSVAAVISIRGRGVALVASSPALVLLWRLGREFVGLVGYGKLEFMSDSAALIFRRTVSMDTSTAVVIFGWLAILARKRSVGLADAGDRNLMRIALWFLGVAGVAMIEADGKVITWVLAGATVVNALTMLQRARKQRARRRQFLDEIGRGLHARWKLGPAPEVSLPPLLDPPGDGTRALFEVAPTGGYREGGLERPVARL